MHKLSIIIVNYNVKHYLDQCLQSVWRAVDGMDAEVVVVDNHSRDGSVEYLSERHPRARFIASLHNLGFAKANNLAIRQTESEYVLLLNPDTVVGEGSVKQVIDFMDAHPKAGACGVKMLQTDGVPARESRRGLPSPMVAFYKMAGLTSRFPRNRRFGRYYMGWLPWDEAAQVEVLSGAFFLARRSVLNEVGLLDEDFFMYGEDIDLSYRILKAGYENWYVPATILHYKGESTAKSSFRYVHVFYDAMLIFLRKHYGHLTLFLSLPIKIAIYLKASVALISTVHQRARKMLGFIQPKREQLLTYQFHGMEEEQAEFIRLANQYGLTVGPSANRVEVFSTTQAFSDILDTPLEGAVFGFFHPDTHTIITPSEIIRP